MKTSELDWVFSGCVLGLDIWSWILILSFILVFLEKKVPYWNMRPSDTWVNVGEENGVQEKEIE